MPSAYRDKYYVVRGRTTNREVQRNIPRYDGNVYIFITPNRVAFRNMHKLCKCAK